MSAHNCTIWTKSDAAKKITVVNSALEDFSPIKYDFNYKQEGNKYKKQASETAKNQRDKVNTLSCSHSLDIWRQSPPEIWEVQVHSLLSPHPAASCKIHCAGSQQRRASSILENIPHPAKMKLYLLTATLNSIS